MAYRSFYSKSNARAPARLTSNMVKHRQITNKMTAAEIITRRIVSDIPTSGGIVTVFHSESNSNVWIF
jgi:hypothetical protein